MRDMKLKPPVIEQTGGNVKVILKHEALATPEEIMLAYLGGNDKITNKAARELCFIGSENKMKGVLQRLVKKGMIELVSGTTRYSAAYRISK
jgi:ATP-dependent DNA helicase RecG